MVANREDKRVRRTKRVVRDALLRLIQDKPVSQVTTTELCREADINRNTFYAHYATPEDVLAEIEEELLAELAAMLEDGYDEGMVTVSMCRAIDESRERWHAIWHGNPRLLERALDMCCERTLAHWDEEGLADGVEGALFMRFITRGASGVVGSWLDDGCRMSPEDLSALIDRFVARGQQAITG